MIEREIRIATPDGEMTTFIAHPDGDLPYRSPSSTWTPSATASRSSRTPAASPPPATCGCRKLGCEESSSLLARPGSFVHELKRHSVLTVFGVQAAV